MLTGSRLHGAGGGCGRQEAGADQSGETCPQLHDGLPHLQEGKLCSFVYCHVNEIIPLVSEILQHTFLLSCKSLVCSFLSAHQIAHVNLFYNIQNFVCTVNNILFISLLLTSKYPLSK